MSVSMMQQSADAWTAGVDEVGRGPLAGPVVAAAVILDPRRPIAGLNDSKKLSDKRRELLALQIRQQARAFALAYASSWEIDQHNILQASLLAMQRAVQGLRIRPKQVLVDGNRLPAWHWPSQAIVGGDGLVDAIAAASILAKVMRDHEMRHLDGHYPGYGFAQHMGYPTAKHRAAILRLGHCPAHRLSFAPLRLG